MSDDYMSEADNEVDGGYFADLEYAYQQKEIRRQEDQENKGRKEENRKQHLLEQNKCIANLKSKLKRKNQQIDQLKQQLAELQSDNKILKDFVNKLDEEFGKNVEPTLSEKADNIIALYRTNKKYCEISEEKIKGFNQQLTEKDKEIERLNHKINVEEPCLIRNYKDMIEQLKQLQNQLAIQELEKVNGILTDTIIEVTENEFDLKKLCYLEEISAKFYEKIQNQIKELRGEKDGR